MRKYIFSLFIAAGFFTCATGSVAGQSVNYNVPLRNSTDSASYYIGISMGTSIASADFESFNTDALAKGAQEAIKAGKNIDVQKMQEISMYLNQYFTKLQARVSERDLKAGQDFLEANRKKQGVIVLPSGLQYKIIREGTGIKPTGEDSVKAEYHGTLIDGTVFDSTKDRGETTTFHVKSVVPGFGEALTLMNEGSIWRVYIPSELGYGERGAGQQIKPNSVIIFEINLVKVIRQPEKIEPIIFVEP